MSTNSFNKLIYLFFSPSDNSFDILIILGSTSEPILQLTTLSSVVYNVGFNKVSSFENNLSSGTSPLGMKFPFKSTIFDHQLNLLYKTHFQPNQHLDLDQLNH